MRWQYTTVVVGVAGLHYVATAIAAHAAVPVYLPFRETVIVQLAAAAANRITPAGLGASGVNARYFSRRGLRASAAIGAVTVLSILGAVADLLVLVVVIVAGRWIGLQGASGELGVLMSHLAQLGSVLASPWLWVVMAILSLAVLWCLTRRRERRTRRWADFWIAIGQLLREPKRLTTLLMASGCTALVLAVAFAASAAMVPGPQPRVALGALIVAFMVGAAAGSSVPVPAGLGSTEVALIGVLIALQVPASHAVEQVLVFRLITFWAPAVVGVLATRYLHKRRAI